MSVIFQSIAGSDDTPIEVTAHIEPYADAIGAPPEMRHMAPGHSVEILEVRPLVVLSRKELARLEEEALAAAQSGEEWEPNDSA